MENLKKIFRFNTNEEGEVLEKKIQFNYETLVGSFKNLVVFLLSVLISMAKLSSGAAPFAFAIFCAMGACEVPLIIPWVFISFTVKLAFNSSTLVKFLVATIVFVLMKSFIKHQNTKIGNSYTVMFSCLISEVVGLTISGALVYDILMAIYMTIMTGIFYLIFAEGLPVLIHAIERQHVYSPEQVASAGVILTIILSRFSSFGFFGITLCGVMSSLIVMILAWRRGAAVGAASGIAISIMLALLGYGTVATIATYGFCGLLMGILARFGKIGVIIGFIIGNMILAFYANASTEVIISIKDILVASIALLLLPKSVTVVIDDLFDYNMALPEGKDGFIEESTMLKLDAACDVVNDMAENVAQKSKEESVPDAMGSFIKTLNDNTCKRCEHYQKCWEKNYHKMYQTTFDAITILQQKGEILSKDLEDSCCENQMLLADGLNMSYELYKVNQEWQQKMNENKKHIAKQLKEVSHALSKMKTEMKETVVKESVKEESKSYSLEIGIAKRKKNNSIISGDSTTVIKLKDGKVLVGLSDGMGSGEMAARNSKKVMLTLEKFLNTGFDKETAVKLLNSYLLIGKEEDNFATLDAAIFDPKTAEVEFMKVSACPTLLKQKDDIKEISSMSLPIGIVDDINVELKKEKLKKGDYFVMVSDGITDVSAKMMDEKNIVHLLEEIKTENSQRLADIILQETLDATYGIAKDDMTVLTVKVV